ncbi:hypothetical protein VTJ83DRAFT_5088 [Remersonia thermophila]|uniref:Zn(2)-C6 fungal-type domain-containing protein n=1 Tax=Remersonia thermophila TaxID=72144 RepID=A0ABR4DBV5_9PEZI
MNSGRRARSHSRPPRSGARPRSRSIAVPSRSSPSPAPGKSKRVRTGCLTCRERHLKCDEGVPDCNNCQKSNRECRRGLRLNFIDIQVGNPPCLPESSGWSFQILDESRSIAAEYQGGLGRYPGAAVSPSSLGDASPTVGQASREGSQATAAGIFQPGADSSREGRGPLNLLQANSGGHLPGPPPGPLLDGSDPVLAQANAIYPPLTSSYAPPPLPSFAAPGRDAVSAHSALGGYGAAPSSFSPEPPGVGSDADSMMLSPPCVPQNPAPPLGSWRPSPAPPRFSTPSGLMTPSSETTNGERDYLNADDEIHLMQVFVDEVAVWMDALDKDQHFANVVPYMALKRPMLFHALLACGAQRLALAGGGDGERADRYYGLASGQLQRSQQERDRDLTECALTAVVLNAYDVMDDRPAQRMQHIASTRALLLECGWDASSGGLGAACFWVNVGMEVLSCLSFGWPTAWDPDQWGLDLEFASLGAASRSGSRSVLGSDDGPARALLAGAMPDGADLGDEELWVLRIFYIMAKIANFRASAPQPLQERSPHDEQVRLQARFSEWRRLQNMCNSWNQSCPRSMRPYGYSPGPSARSLFPNVWLIKPAAKLGRLFYHTSMALLAQTHPMAGNGSTGSTGNNNNHNAPSAATDRDARENRASQIHHAHHVCGLVAHARPDRDRDRGVMLIAVRCLAVVGAALVDDGERSEVLALLDKVKKATGWRVERLADELRGAWGWRARGGGRGRGGEPGTDMGMGLTAASLEMGLAGLSVVPEEKVSRRAGPLSHFAGAAGMEGRGGRGARDWG